jgi:ribosomal subunit interface protein
MEIRVSGHQVDTGETLRARVSERLLAIADKYSPRAVSAHVTFGKGPHDHGFTCEIVAHVPHAEVVKATDRAANAPAAFDSAADKVEKQFRRHSRRLKDHRADDPLAAAGDFGDGVRRGGA